MMEEWKVGLPWRDLSETIYGHRNIPGTKPKDYVRINQVWAREEWVVGGIPFDMEVKYS